MKIEGVTRCKIGSAAVATSMRILAGIIVLGAVQRQFVITEFAIVEGPSSVAVILKGTTKANKEVQAVGEAGKTDSIDQTMKIANDLLAFF